MTTPIPGAALKLRVFPAPPITIIAGVGLSVSKSGNAYSISINAAQLSSGVFDAAFGSVPGTYLRRDSSVWTGSAILGDDLPNPSITTKGGVKASNLAAGNFVGAIDTTGTPTAAQRAVVAGATLTGSANDSIASFAQTWNTSGTVRAIDLSITNAASNAASQLLRLRSGAAGTTEIFSVLAGATAPTFNVGGRLFGQAPSGSPNQHFSAGGGLGIGFVNGAGSAVIGNISDTGVFSFSGTTSGTHTLAAAAAASGASTFPNQSGEIINTGLGFPMAQFGVAVDFNSVADTSIAIKLPTGCTRYRIASIIVVNTGAGAASLTTAQCGVFTAAAGGGTAVVTGGSSLAAITSNTQGTASATLALPIAVANAWWDIATVQTLFFRITTAQGAAALGRVVVQIQPVP